MSSNTLNGLIDTFTRALENTDLEQKKLAFLALQKYFFAHGASQDAIDLVLIACTLSDDIRSLGKDIAQLASIDVQRSYRRKLIACGDCASLLALVKLTLSPLTRDEMVKLGHQIEVHGVRVIMYDAIKLLITAKDTPEMNELDCRRLELQLGYDTRSSQNGW